MTVTVKQSRPWGSLKAEVAAALRARKTAPAIAEEFDCSQAYVRAVARREKIDYLRIDRTIPRAVKIARLRKDCERLGFFMVAEGADP